MDASGIGMAIADMPRELFKGRSRQQDSDPRPSTADNSSHDSVTDDGTLAGTKNRVSELPVDSMYDPSILTSDSSGAAWDQSSQSQSLPAESASSLVTTPTATTSTSSSNRRKKSASQRRTSDSPRESSPVGIGMDTAVNAGRSVGRVVGTGVKSPMNFCLGLAKGFRNLPRLYNDETLRPPEKVTDIPSGIKVASKEFGYGLFDGISGLVMQPIKGAEKEGYGGLVKGVGKGIGGLIAKPAAGAPCRADSQSRRIC